MSKKSGFTRRQFLGGASATAVGTLLGPAASRAAGDNAATEIVRAAIYPGIGVARIGNSRDEEGYFIGPEVAEPALTAVGQTRDFSGAIKRQAARFRIYGYNSAGEVVRELTSENSEIEWSVHLANKKAQWYRFIVALDIPEAAGSKVKLRNSDVSDRHRLAIDPGARTIAGVNQSGAKYQFDKGRFRQTEVSLGEVRTDGKGRLLVLGGVGNSGSPEHKPPFDPKHLDTFNNADGWYDDTGDGPVRATVRIGGQTIPVESSWVIVAPPNYAPDVLGWRTMYDLMMDTFIGAGMMAAPAATSFTRDIMPILQRLTNLQWVNKGFADAFRKGLPMNFQDPDLLARLAKKPESAEAALLEHKAVFDLFRLPTSDPKNARLWPMLYGDAYGSYTDSPRVDFVVSDLMALHLKRWAQGEFINDFGVDDTRPYRRLSDVPLKDQPDMLNRAAMQYCLADAFHPGCELTWPMRHASLYESPFRIRQLPKGDSPRDYGAHLTPEIALGDKGPLHAQGPGDLTKWMALPWQGDTAFCRSGYEPEFDPYLPTFWPARVPNQVLSEDDYRTVMDLGLSREERLKAFQNREHWVRALKGSLENQIQQMVGDFGRMGVIEARPGIENDPDFPAVIFVESVPMSLSRSAPPPVETSAPAGAHKKSMPTPEEVRLHKAGWESQDQLDEFRKLLRLKPKP